MGALFLLGVAIVPAAPASALEAGTANVTTTTAEAVSQRLPVQSYRADFTARVGDWFIYARKNGSDEPRCSAVREEWSQSLYLSLDQAGWSVGTDSLFRVSGTREITLNGVQYVASFDDRSGLPSFTPDAEMLQALGETGGFIGFAPGSEQRMFSLHQSGQALDMVRLCTESRGLMPDTRPEVKPALASDCPDVSAYTPAYGDFTDLTVKNLRDDPVQVYVLSQYKDTPEFLGSVLREHSLQTSIGNIYLVADLSGHCIGSPMVVTESGQVLTVQ
ncbi:hypothetical protein DL237_16555 [Pseudooceanicola sediminis]|uniref:Uncharacterized protein n=1 Tax=Pseudooceanicola sediminis TaxID=2211117 RepID=A0A399IWD5_9RHOB|nr:hypothetical protein DL237_16555 [Pseudooceanicola sediminis]